ncbi:MAG: hypothetical protein IJR99_03470 [Kiritimatiellae bacterium]|nr:hypothetical protein [Kiritimatiellia bacterium]
MLFDMISLSMFLCACKIGRDHGSLLVGALVGCFTMFSLYWGGWGLGWVIEQSRNRFLQKYDGLLLLPWAAFLFGVSIFLPPFVLSFTASSN